MQPLSTHTLISSGLKWAAGSVVHFQGFFFFALESKTEGSKCLWLKLLRLPCWHRGLVASELILAASLAVDYKWKVEYKCVPPLMLHLRLLLSFFLVLFLLLALQNSMILSGLSWEDLLHPLYQKYKNHITWGDQDLLNIIFHYNPGAVPFLLVFSYRQHWWWKIKYSPHLPVLPCFKLAFKLVFKQKRTCLLSSAKGETVFAFVFMFVYSFSNTSHKLEDEF